MSNADVTRDLRRAELARVRLAQDLSTAVQTGNRLLERARSLLNKAVPIALALGLLGLVFFASLASRRNRRSFVPPRKPSFVSELLRRAAVAAAATLAGRLARRLPQLPAAVLNPAVEEFKSERGPGPRRAPA